jgi:hypothetical protein
MGFLVDSGGSDAALVFLIAVFAVGAVACLALHPAKY